MGNYGAESTTQPQRSDTCVSIPLAEWPVFAAAAGAWKSMPQQLRLFAWPAKRDRVIRTHCFIAAKTLPRKTFTRPGLKAMNLPWKFFGEWVSILASAWQI